MTVITFILVGCLRQDTNKKYIRVCEKTFFKDATRNVERLKRNDREQDEKKQNRTKERKKERQKRKEGKKERINLKFLSYNICSNVFGRSKCDYV